MSVSRGTVGVTQTVHNIFTGVKLLAEVYRYTDCFATSLLLNLCRTLVMLDGIPGIYLRKTDHIGKGDLGSDISEDDETICWLEL